MLFFLCLGFFGFFLLLALESSDINLLNLLSGNLRQKSNLCTHRENIPVCPVAIFSFFIKEIFFFAVLYLSSGPAVPFLEGMTHKCGIQVKTRY